MGVGHSCPTFCLTMAYELPQEIRRKAERKLRGLDYLELCNPGTYFSAEGHILVSVQDKATGSLLWLDLSDAESDDGRV